MAVHEICLFLFEICLFLFEICLFLFEICLCLFFKFSVMTVNEVFLF